MENLPSLITDLALILILAGVVTVVFKRLKQPLVLGYIVAGFLAGPYMTYMPSISDEHSIEVWSQIGIIFLMFSLGLEFSFKKILKSGLSPIITACFIMMCMMFIGYGVGQISGFSSINSIFLGGMLSMSSTTIIYKAYSDMGLRNKRFASRVMSVLVMEDILGIVLMVMLTALAQSNSLHGSELVISIIQLIVFLLLWFLIGIWLIPSLLRRYSSYINKETLLIVSVGLCFLMVVIANHMGYSPALGAFMMGSILAETIEAERIDESISGVKDLFGAIFFVSVGMMVEPQMLINYWKPIAMLVGAVIFGQMLFGTLGFLLSRSSLAEAIKSGFSMAQIGEFAFIIATLGISLHVTDDFLYPVVVAVSIITTFMTPHMIRLSQYIVDSLHSSVSAEEESSNHVSVRNVTGKDRDRSYTPLKAWRRLLLSVSSFIIAYGTLCIGIIELLFVSLLVFCRRITDSHWPGNIICGIISLIVLSLFLRPIVMKKNNSTEAKYLRAQGKIHERLLLVLFIIRLLLASGVVYFVLNFLSPFRWYYHIVVSILIVLLILRSRRVKYISLRMERTFKQNMRRRDIMLNKSSDGPMYARRLRGHDLHISQLTLPQNSTWEGKTLAQLHIGGKNAVHVTAIVRQHRRINTPGGDTMLFPNDIIEVVGDDDSIEQFALRMESECQPVDNKLADDMQLQRFSVGALSPMVGLFIKQSGIRDKHRCVVVGFEEQDGSLSIASADRKIEQGDILWLAGESDKLAKLKVMLEG